MYSLKTHISLSKTIKDEYSYEHWYFPEGGTECYTRAFAAIGYNNARIFRNREFEEWFLMVSLKLQTTPHWEYVIRKGDEIVGGFIFYEYYDFEVGNCLGLLVGFTSEQKNHAFGCWRWMLELAKEKNHHTVFYSRNIGDDGKSIRFEYIYKTLRTKYRKVNEPESSS